MKEQHCFVPAVSGQGRTNPPLQVFLYGDSVRQFIVGQRIENKAVPLGVDLAHIAVHRIGQVLVDKVPGVGWFNGPILGVQGAAVRERE